MKTKHHHKILFLSLLITVLLLCAGCSGQKEAASDGPYIQYQGTKVAIGMKFEDVKDGLGTESRAPEEIIPCGVEDAVDTLHYYPGFGIMENQDGIIFSIEISAMYPGESDVALNGKLKLGDPKKTVFDVLGEAPEEPGLEGIFTLTVYMDPDAPDSVHIISLMENPS